MVTPDDIIRVLRESDEPLAVTDIASRVGGDVRECDRTLWENPERFAWQPGHKWAIANAKSRAFHTESGHTPDARSGMASANYSRELRALTLSTGLNIAVDRRPLDSDAFFTVRSAGNTVTLTLNSVHELFLTLPMPFEDNKHASYKELCEVLLSAWALYEDGLPGGTKRATQDARLLWGRRTIEMLREREP